MAKQSLLLISLLLLIVSLLHSTTLAAISPATVPSQPPPTTPPAAAAAPSGNTTPGGGTDIVQILQQANSFNMFLRLMKTTQLGNQLNSQLATIKSGGLTVLAPDDGAFSELKPGFLNSLSDGKKLELMQFHVLPDLVSSSNFDTLTNPVRTLAGNKPGKVELNVISYGGNVNISTGAVNATINGVLYTDNHLVIYRVGKVLIPSEFVPAKKATAPAPALKPKPKPIVSATPVTTDVAEAPKPAKQKPAPKEQSSESSTQVVPTMTSGGVRLIFGVSGTYVSLVLGVVFVGASTWI